MDTTRRENFEEQLLTMRDRLTGEIGNINEYIIEEVEHTADQTHVPTHPADQDSEGLTREIALEQNEALILEEVVAALDRLENGTYGECENCGAAISLKRLDAMPYARYCIACQTAFERAQQG